MSESGGVAGDIATIEPRDFMETFISRFCCLPSFQALSRAGEEAATSAGEDETLARLQLDETKAAISNSEQELSKLNRSVKIISDVDYNNTVKVLICIFVCLCPRQKKKLETEMEKLKSSKHELQSDIRFVTTFWLRDTVILSGGHALRAVLPLVYTFTFTYHRKSKRAIIP